jgi:hypothetical protein
MGRREFITLLGGATAAWPLTARAQQPKLPVIGFLSSISEEFYILEAFRRGLLEQGYIEGRNVVMDYRYAEGRYERLPALAAELVSRRVNVIAAVGSSPAALAAKAATQTIPIVFLLGVDVVELGLAASYSRPGGNATGVSVIVTSLTPKRLELLDVLAPKPAPLAELGRVDSSDPVPCCCDAQHREVSSGGFLVAGRDATKLLETVDAALDEIASLVCFAIVFDLGFSVRAGRDHRFNATLD